MESWDKDSIITLKGYWVGNHTFVTGNQSFEIWYNHMIKPEMNLEYYINVKYIQSLGLWVAFQIIPENGDDESTHHGF